MIGVLGFILAFTYLRGYYDLFIQLLFVSVFFFAVAWIINRLRRNYIWLKHWAMHYNFKFREKASNAVRMDRFYESRDKQYFKSRSVKPNFDEAPAIEGKINKRKIWIFGFIGVYPFNKILHTGGYKFWDFSLRNPIFPDNRKIKDNRQKFTGWCMEISTHKVPISLIVRRNYLGGRDEIDTESHNFEKIYHVDVYNGHGTLQLLDPMMIQLIMDSGISAFEFSDSSVALYYTLYKPSRDQLDKMLGVGLKVAEQVDRNFPLGKFNK